MFENPKNHCKTFQFIEVIGHDILRLFLGVFILSNSVVMVVFIQLKCIHQFLLCTLSLRKIHPNDNEKEDEGNEGKKSEPTKSYYRNKLK